MIDIEESLKELGKNDKVCIPYSLRRRVDETYGQLQKTTGIKDIIKNSIKVAAILTVILFCTNFVVPTIAEEIPIVGPILKIINNKRGCNLRYTDNGLVVNQKFNTENYSVDIETVDYDGEKILIVYKVVGIKNTTPWPCALGIDISSDFFTIEEQGSMATGGIQGGAYYGYQQYEINMKNEFEAIDDINLRITPKLLVAGDNEENFINSKEINLTVKDKNYR